MVLHVTGTAGGARVDVALELGEDLGVRLTHDVGEYVQAAAVGHADDDLVELRIRSAVDSGIHQWDQRLRALQGEALLADVLSLQEVLEGLSGVQLLQDVLLLGGGELRLAALDVLLQPQALVLIHDVRVLVADLAGVGLTQGVEHLAQGHGLATIEATNVKGAVEIPQGQAVRFDVQVGVIRHWQTRLDPVQRVDVRDEVTAGAVGLDELRDTGGLIHTGVRQILGPADRRVRDVHGLEDLVPEAVVDQQAGHGPQELAGLRTLDDAVVVGRGDGDELANTHLAEAVDGRALELGRVIHRTNADDRALAVGQTRHGVAGTDATRVGQGDGHALEVIHRQLADAGAGDDVLVGVDELGEVHLLRLLDRCHDQATAAVLVVHVDRQAQVDVLRGDDGRLVVDDLVIQVHVRVSLNRADQGPADNVRKADLAATAGKQLLVDDRAVFEHQLRWHVADRGCGRDAQRGIHVLSDGAGCATQHLLASLRGLYRMLRLRRGDALRNGVISLDDTLVGVATQATASTGSGGGGASGGGRSALGARSGTVICARRAAGGVAVLLEVLPPFGVNRLRILLILLVHLIDQPFVLTEIRAAHSRSSPLFIMTSVSLYQPTRCAMRFRFQVARHRPAENGV